MISKYIFREYITFFSRSIFYNFAQAAQNQAVKQKKEDKSVSSVQLKDLLLHYNVEKVNSVFKDIDFEKNIKPAIEQFKQIGFTKNSFSQIFNRSPYSLLIKTKAEKDGRNISPVTDIIELSKFLKEKYNFNGSQIKALVLNYPKILFISTQEIEKRISFIKKELQLTDNEVNRILFFYPITMNKLYQNKINEKKIFLHEWIKLDVRTLGIISSNFPYFLDIPQNIFKENVKTLLSKHFSPENIKQIMLTNPECFCLNPSNLNLAFDLPIQKLKLPSSTYIKNMTDFPRLLTCCPTTSMPTKFKIFTEDFGLTVKQTANIYTEFPIVFTYEPKIIKLKLKYIVERLRVKLTEESTFPSILSFNYTNIIRPRGEAMIKLQNIYPLKEILFLSDKEFCDKIGIKLEDYEKQKKEIEPIPELEIRKFFFQSTYRLMPELLKSQDKEIIQKFREPWNIAVNKK